MHICWTGLDAVPVLDDQEVTTYKNGDLLLVLRPRLRTPSHERFPHVQVATLEWFFSHDWDTDGTIISKVHTPDGIRRLISPTILLEEFAQRASSYNMVFVPLK
jgi:hypothetical protein